VHVDADPARAMAATVASSAQEVEQAAGFAPMHGYTTDALLKDKRFKVQQQDFQVLLFAVCKAAACARCDDMRLMASQVLEALRQHSLHTTGYARQALLAVSPATIPRRDTLTTAAKD